MIVLALLLQATSASPSATEGQTAINPTTGERVILRDGQWQPILGPGPHTLVVTDGEAITRFDYKSGPKCERARDVVQRQNAPPPDTDGRIYGAPRVRAFCVPR